MKSPILILNKDILSHDDVADYVDSTVSGFNTLSRISPKDTVSGNEIAEISGGIANNQQNLVVKLRKGERLDKEEKLELLGTLKNATMILESYCKISGVEVVLNKKGIEKYIGDFLTE